MHIFLVRCEGIFHIFSFKNLSVYFWNPTHNTKSRSCVLVLEPNTQAADSSFLSRALAATASLRSSRQMNLFLSSIGERSENSNNMNKKTSGAILFRNTMKYDTRNADNFKRAIHNAVEFAKNNAPQLMVQVFIDEKLGLAYSFQLYQSSDDILEHWKVSDEYIDEVMKYCEVKSLEVYGNPSKEVLNGIIGSVDDDKVTFTPELVGFHRFK